MTTRKQKIHNQYSNPPPIRHVRNDPRYVKMLNDQKRRVAEHGVDKNIQHIEEAVSALVNWLDRHGKTWNVKSPQLKMALDTAAGPSADMHFIPIMVLLILGRFYERNITAAVELHKKLEKEVKARKRPSERGEALRELEDCGFKLKKLRSLSKKWMRENDFE